MGTETGGEAWTRPLHPLRVPIFRLVWIASFVSNLGALIQSVGASWMMMSMAASPQMIALVQASATLPIMLLSLWGGVIADNLDRRKVMLCAQSFLLLVSAGLAACTWAGLLSPWLLLAFTFSIGCGAALNAPAGQASVGDMVPRTALPSAITFNTIGFNVARSLGPALGGMIVALAGVSAAFISNTLSYVGLIIVLALWQPQAAPRLRPRERLRSAMATGLRYVRGSSAVRAILLRAGFFGIGAGAVPALLPLVARDLIVGGAVTYGFLLAAFGVGAVIGASLSGVLRGRYSSEIIVRAGSILVGIGAAVTGISSYAATSMAALLLAGAGWVMVLSTCNVTVQLSAPRWVVGRALALYQMAAFGGMTLGSWIFGAVAEGFGVAAGLLVAGALQAPVIACGFILPLSDDARAKAAPDDFPPS